MLQLQCIYSLIIVHIIVTCNSLFKPELHFRLQIPSPFWQTTTELAELSQRYWTKWIWVNKVYIEEMGKEKICFINYAYSLYKSLGFLCCTALLFEQYAELKIWPFWFVDEEHF